MEFLPSHLHNHSEGRDTFISPPPGGLRPLGSNLVCFQTVFLMPPVTTIRPGCVVRGPTLPEPVEVLAVVPLGTDLKVIGRGLNTGLTHDPVLTPDQLARLEVTTDRLPLDGDARLFRLGVERLRLGLGRDYDPLPTVRGRSSSASPTTSRT